MARCEQGYLCDVCGEEVEDLVESALYLRYVVGRVRPEALHTSPERHLRCDPVLAQFIDDARFPPVEVEGDFDKRRLDPQYVAQQQDLLTRGWRRLLEIAGQELSLIEYPLPEVQARLRREIGEA